MNTVSSMVITAYRGQQNQPISDPYFLWHLRRLTRLYNNKTHDKTRLTCENSVMDNLELFQEINIQYMV